MVDGAGHPVPFGEVGVIEIHSDIVPERYIDDDEQSAASFHDGWYRSPDLGRMVGPGRFVLIGRADDMVVMGGMKIAPQAVEDRVRALDGVRDAVLIAVPSRDGPDVAHLVLEGAPGLLDNGVLSSGMQSALADILRGTVSSVVPVVMAALPRTETGKVRRQALRERLGAPMTAVTP
jgi:acyl-coenzyme A synthetase/AMP-(fatty) acid ligase